MPSKRILVLRTSNFRGTTFPFFVGEHTFCKSRLTFFIAFAVFYKFRLTYYVFNMFLPSELVYLSSVNADVQGTAKWIEFNQTGNSCTSLQSAFPAVVACYAMFLNLSCTLEITRQQQLTFNCMGNGLLGLQMFFRSSLTWAYCSCETKWSKPK